MGKKDTKVIITVSVWKNSYETAKLLAARKGTTLDSIVELSLEELVGNNKELLNNPTPNLVQHQEKNACISIWFSNSKTRREGCHQTI